jgi:hypothetical protein
MDGLSLHRGVSAPRRYNGCLLDSDAKTKAAQARVLRAETIGLLVLGLLILSMILVRWGHFLHWHAR